MDENCVLHKINLTPLFFLFDDSLNIRQFILYGFLVVSKMSEKK